MDPTNAVWLYGETPVCSQHNTDTLNLQNIQAAHAAQYQKNEQPNQKVGKRANQTFLKKLKSLPLNSGTRVPTLTTVTTTDKELISKTLTHFVLLLPLAVLIIHFMILFPHFQFSYFGWFNQVATYSFSSCYLEILLSIP